MKIRSQMLTRILGLLAAWLVRVWIGSLRVRSRALAPAADPLHRDCDRGYVYATWHDGLLLPVYLYRRCRPYTIVSKSADGEWVARIAAALGWRVIRGSTSRAAVPALRQALSATTANEQVHLALAVDGPRGPRHVLQPGAIYVAAKTGRPIVPVALAFERAWRARSWDRFILPRPFSRVFLLLGEPTTIPHDATRQTVEEQQHRLQQEMDRLCLQAEQYLNGKGGPPEKGAITDIGSAGRAA